MSRIHHVYVFLVVVCAVLILGASAFFPSFSAGSKKDDLYAVLGVTRKATGPEIKKAFRQKTRDAHPDLKETAEEKDKAKDDMAKILRAYEVLSDAEKKEQYDRYGVIPGEGPTPSGMHQQHGGFPAGFPFGFPFQQRPAEPIKSKTPTIESVLQFRELVDASATSSNVLLFQAYHDGCFECRLFSSAWESLRTSGWASGAVDMYRISMDADDGFEILGEAGLSYGPAPVVFAVAAKTVFQLSQLPGTLFRERQHMIQPLLFDFVGSFFVDAPVAAAGRIATPTSLEEALAAHPLSSAASGSSRSAAAWMLLVSTSIEVGLTHSLASRHAHLSVRVAEASFLKDLIASVCKMNLDTHAKDFLVAFPVFAVARRSLLAEWCPFLHVATSASSLSPIRAVAFVDKLFQVAILKHETSASHRSKPHQQTSPIFLASSSTLRSRCFRRKRSGSDGDAGPASRGCALLLVANCSFAWSKGSGSDFGTILQSIVNKEDIAFSSGAAAGRMFRASDVLEDLSPYQGGFICLDAEPKLAAFLLSQRTFLATPQDLDGSFLVIDSSNHQQANALDVFVTVRVPSARSHTHAAQSLHEFLADVVEGLPPQHPFRIRGVSAEALLANMFHITFAVSGWRWVQWKAAAWADSVSGLLSFVPLLVVWLTMRWCKGGPPKRADPNNTRNATGTTAPSNNSSTTSGSSKGAALVCPVYSVPYFCSEDIRRAESTKGFLILIFDKGTGGRACTGVLPGILTKDETRFTVRVVEVTHKKWWLWLDSILASAGRGSSGTHEGPLFVAIRKGKLTACVKPAHTTTAVWTSELLDGTCSTSEALPAP